MKFNGKTLTVAAEFGGGAAAAASSFAVKEVDASGNWVEMSICGDVPASMFNGTMKALAKVTIKTANTIGAAAFYVCSALAAFIIERTDEVVTLANTNAFSSTPIASGTGYIYVPDALVDTYKAATNWATYAAQIKPRSELGG